MPLQEKDINNTYELRNFSVLPEVRTHLNYSSMSTSKHIHTQTSNHAIRTVNVLC